MNYIMSPEQICKDILFCNMGFGNPCTRRCGEYFNCRTTAQDQDKWTQKKMIEEYHCKECDTPGFIHLVIPVKEIGE